MEGCVSPAVFFPLFSLAVLTVLVLVLALAEAFFVVSVDFATEDLVDFVAAVF